MGVFTLTVTWSDAVDGDIQDALQVTSQLTTVLSTGDE